MKKIFYIMILFTALFTSCGKTTQMYDVHKKIAEMKGYTSNAEIEIVGNKGTSSYKVKQYYLSPDKVRIEVLEPDFIRGKITIYDGEKWIIYNPLINQKIQVKESKNSEEFIYLGVLQKSLLSGEEAKFKYANKDGKDYIEIKATIPGGNKYRRSVVLYVTKENYYPVFMEIFDDDNNVVVKVKYSDFVYDGNINQSLFKLD